MLLVDGANFLKFFLSLFLLFFQDVSRIRSSMLNLFDDYEVPFAQWNHLDYLWAVDANRYVYDRLVQNINSAQSILK